ncbi:MAG: HDOD domain-containing protein [Desulfotalea sp.]
MFIGRQPIFDRKKNLFAYELLYRAGMSNIFPTPFDGDKATSSVLTSTFFISGIKKVSGGNLCFVKFPKDLLLNDNVNLFSPKDIVIEILEDVEPTPEIISICQNLVDSGYKIALDKFVYSEAYEPLLRIADFVKIDFAETDLLQIRHTVDIIKKHKCNLIAEKIESHEEFKVGRLLGFQYFQGFFFAKPEIIRSRDIKASQHSLIKISTELNQPSFNIEKIEQIIKVDVAISHKLLNFLNSSYFSLLSPVRSIRQAIVFLGEGNAKHFLSLIVMTDVCGKKPLELAKLSVIRAMFLHRLGGKIEGSHQEELFLLGLFSLIPAMLDCSTEDILDLPLSDSVKDAIATKSGKFYPFLELAKAYEELRLEEVKENICLQKLGAQSVIDSYIDAIKLSDGLFNEPEGQYE